MSEGGGWGPDKSSWRRRPAGTGCRWRGSHEPPPFSPPLLNPQPPSFCDLLTPLCVLLTEMMLEPTQVTEVRRQPPNRFVCAIACIAASVTCADYTVIAICTFWQTPRAPRRLTRRRCFRIFGLRKWRAHHCAEQRCPPQSSTRGWSLLPRWGTCPRHLILVHTHARPNARPALGLLRNVASSLWRNEGREIFYECFGPNHAHVLRASLHKVLELLHLDGTLECLGYTTHGATQKQQRNQSHTHTHTP